MRSTLLIAGAVILTGSAVVTRPAPDTVSRAVAEVERLNDLRESLARQFESAPAATQSRFKEVCQPVGVEVQRIATETGWKMQQLAVKYRNPVNRADREAEHFLHLLAADTKVGLTPEELDHCFALDRVGESSGVVFQRLGSLQVG